MSKKSAEWRKQSDYDMDTAEFMFRGKRYFYSVFMCHLSVEKALKGLYQKKLKEVPPKVHNLIYFLNKLGVKPPENIGRFLVRLNEASVITRYPEELDKLRKEYTKAVVKEILSKSKEALKWIKKWY